MTRMSVFTREETITVTPLRAFPVVRDLVTDVGFNYTKAREVPAFVPPEGVGPGEYRMMQEDVDRSQEFRKCIECFLCQDTCHVGWTARRRPRTSTASATATSPSAARRSAPRASRSRTTR
jgi:succinate dehydrogenase/fumarate reductase-like Fe-S protein